jgi:hypothetical protein
LPSRQAALVATQRPAFATVELEARRTLEDLAVAFVGTYSRKRPFHSGLVKKRATALTEC